jgi:hypothetical protein
MAGKVQLVLRSVSRSEVEDNPREELVWFWGNTMACFQAELSISSGPSAIALAISQSLRASTEQCFAPRNKLARRHCGSCAHQTLLHLR